MKNIFTVDLEDWYHGNFIENSSNQGIAHEERLIDSTNKILALLKNTNNSATFFVLGVDAEKYPDLIRKIYEEKHEIASHGYEHLLVYNRSKESFSIDLKKSLNVLESIINTKVIGFRAPYWSVKKDLEWIWEVLIENGIKYDSSMYPFRTYLYGNNKSSRFCYKIQVNSGYVYEIPPTVYSLWSKRIPFLGGFFFRILPYGLTKIGLEKINLKEKQPGVFYIHPWELDPNKPTNAKGYRDKFILNYNIKNTEKKINRLLNDFQFTSIKDYFNIK